MEKISDKFYSLVAWTDKGHVRMIPSLAKEVGEPNNEKSAQAEASETRPKGE